MTTAEKALQFIQDNVKAGKTVYLSTAYTHIKINQKTLAKFAIANYPLFKFNQDGDLLIASGKKYNIICCKNFKTLPITAV